MPEHSVRMPKSCKLVAALAAASSSSGASSGSLSSNSNSAGASAHKFSNIVNKAESLINKIHHDKLNNVNLQANAHKNNHNNKHDKKAAASKRDKLDEPTCHMCASLDSLNNLTDADSFEELDSDDAEIVAHITGTTAAQVHQNQNQHQQQQQHQHQQRHTRLDQLTNESIRELNVCNEQHGDAWAIDFEPATEEANEHRDSPTHALCHEWLDKNSKHLEHTQAQRHNDVEPASTEQHAGDCLSSVAAVPPTPRKPLELTSAAALQMSSKVRRVSNASSGSISRMETILEEPNDSKISVREILARFENLTETQPKSTTTLSSGARAAAQILNVPIERLESRQSNQRTETSGYNDGDLGELSNGNGNGNCNGNGNIGSQQHQHQHREQQQQQQLRHIQRTDTEVDDDEVDDDDDDDDDNDNDGDVDDDEHVGGNVGNEAGGHNDDNDGEILGELHDSNGNPRRLDAGHADRHRYMKQMSYLHAGRKSNANATNGHGLEVASYLQEHADASNGIALPATPTKYSLLQFAMQHFRNDAPEARAHYGREHDRSGNAAAVNRSYGDLVKWQGQLIRTPLLRLPNELAPLAIECFECILRYCGDIPLEPDLTEVKCVYTVLMHCHKYLALRDEVYCQLMKQTTANRSLCADSSQRAWRLLSILAAYFGCSDALRPYLMEHLTSAASDRRRSCHGTAAVCLTNLRKTARCGGRKNVPSVEEVTAVSAGRSARRQIYRLPGGAERVVNTRCSTVVADVIAELCALLGIDSEDEQQEFSLYCIVQGDAFTMPLSADEYILDVTTELLKSGQPFYLIFCRSVWHFALKRDPAPMPLYVEVLFNQVAPDYLEGLLLELPGNGGVPMPEVVRDMARIAALLHRAADLSHVPAMKEIKFLLPKPALGIREIRPAQWVSMVQSAWPQIAGLSPGQVKAQFLNVLATWPLFGSSFFAVKRIWANEEVPSQPQPPPPPTPHNDDSHSPMWRDLILALNRRGVLFLDPSSHETLQHWSFMEVISTRKVRSEDGALFLDMKVGNLMQQRVIRVQTEQAHEISRLVRQYITMAQNTQRDKRIEA